MSFVKSTQRYEKWLGERLRLVPADLAFKHQRMAESFFAFFRGTFYRWAELWPGVAGPMAEAPVVLAVADLHVENFGTWRDQEGRLVWGINDFDEAFPMAFTNDLVRLLASVQIAGMEHPLRVKGGAAAEILLDGYRRGLEAGGKPFVLAEEQTPLRELARERLKDPEKFWARLEAQPKERQIPRGAEKALRAALPKDSEAVRFARRVAGVGSLGRERFIAIALVEGGRVAREVKARTPSACVWAGARGNKDYYRRLIGQAVRCPDPMLDLTNDWVIRRLSPDCCRLELTQLPSRWNEKAILLAMGWETANNHLASGPGPAVLKHLKKIQPATLKFSATAMVEALAGDWKSWRKFQLGE